MESFVLILVGAVVGAIVASVYKTQASRKDAEIVQALRDEKKTLTEQIIAMYKEEKVLRRRLTKLEKATR